MSAVGDLSLNYLRANLRVGWLAFGQQVRNANGVKHRDLWKKSNRLTTLRMCDLLLTQK